MNEYRQLGNLTTSKKTQEAKINLKETLKLVKVRQPKSIDSKGYITNAKYLSKIYVYLYDL